MTKRFILLIGCLFLVAATWQKARAGVSGAPQGDTYIAKDGNNHNGDSLQLAGSSFGGSCQPERYAYLQWDVSGLPGGGTDTAVLTLETSVLSNAAEVVIGLYETTDDWNGATAGSGDETTLTDNNAPAVGALIMTAPAPATVGSQLVFSGDALKNYVNAQRAGDGIASFVLKLDSNCKLLTVVSFVDEESGSANTSYNGPFLSLQSPTAVTLQSHEVGDGVGQDAGIFVVFLILLATTLVAALLGKNQRPDR